MTLPPHFFLVSGRVKPAEPTPKKVTLLRWPPMLENWAAFCTAAMWMKARRSLQGRREVGGGGVGVSVASEPGPA